MLCSCPVGYQGTLVVVVDGRCGISGESIASAAAAAVFSLLLKGSFHSFLLSVSLLIRTIFLAIPSLASSGGSVSRLWISLFSLCGFLHYCIMSPSSLFPSRKLFPHISPSCLFLLLPLAKAYHVATVCFFSFFFLANSSIRSCGDDGGGSSGNKLLAFHLLFGYNQPTSTSSHI